MYYVPESRVAPGAGHDKITELLSDPRYECAEVTSLPHKSTSYQCPRVSSSLMIWTTFLLFLFEDKKAAKLRSKAYQGTSSDILIYEQVISLGPHEDAPVFAGGQSACHGRDDKDTS